MNITRFKKFAKEVDPSIAILVKGPHGIGKSQVVAQVVHELGMELVVFMCSQVGDVGDFIGLPKHVDYVNRFYKVNRVTGEETEITAEEYMKTSSNEEFVLKTTMEAYREGKTEIGLGEITTMTKFCPPYWYRKGVDIGLFLDEINRARPEIGNAAMQLTLEKKILDLELTKGSRVFGAINPSENAKYGVEEMAPAQLDRWLIVELKPTTEEFIEYAETHGIHETIINYIEANPRNLLPWDNEELTNIASQGSENKVPSPRSYEMLSKAVISLEKVDKDYFKGDGGDILLSEITRGCVGPGVALSYPETYYTKSITPEMAMNDPKSCIELLKSYHAGRQKRFLNNTNKYVEEIVNELNLTFTNNELLIKDSKLVDKIKKIQSSYCELINTVKFEVAASVFNKTFVEGISKSLIWIRLLMLEKLKLNGETIELADGTRLKKNYVKNAVEVL